ncbi:hypothetical protein EJ04DRAFT_442212 [Polyplosphaeria fusca]|uniref:Uncharacterized protein n=1 Tax=Polyplosphaeria fusca TaxID=682080 RepID=A0A9P4V063_9PLEO|nr:hypothetical protein EJ04DRAFT_442212 [Polyplosphaeria fusca]
MKRARDDDSDSDDERYMKKTRPWTIQPQHLHGANTYPSLPMRPSFTPSPESSVPNLDAMTCSHSDDDANSPASIQDDTFLFSPRDTTLDMDMAMDDDDLDIISSQPPDSPMHAFTLRPAKLNPDLFAAPTMNASGRIPTPIYPNFQRSSSGMSGLGYPSSGMAGGFHTSNDFLSIPSSNTILAPPPPRKQAHMPDQDRSRRMPSPISEDEDLPDTPTALTQSQLSRLSVASHANSPDAVMDFEAELAADLPPPPGIITTPRGRKRSGAFTGKGRFSMGYREDCEKCRARIPGHYAHFLP